LLGKLILYDDDVDNRTVLPDGFLKKISEEKHLSGRQVYARGQEFIATVLPLCSPTIIRIQRT